MQLRQYLFDTVYSSDRAKAEEPKAYRVVQALFEHYLEDTERTFPRTRVRATRRSSCGASSTTSRA